ncbi:NUDIX hydrolase [Pseudostreptobacillus hongkongensis]|uniref:NUDIX hydrolase n=1 Tax=Pseudostreptobacillus hongkongensis TaxID=1162717 RepID=UPI0028D31067|nr:NUDIX hydrolase [Pseudostreptobacillus hongkongensis]
MAIPIKEGFKFIKGDIKVHPTTNVKLEYIVKSDAVCVTIFDEKLEKVLLVEQYRPGVDGNMFENVAGMIDPGEDPFDAMKRELKEETGYSFDDLDCIVEHKTPILTTPYATEKLYYYAARLKSNDIEPRDTNFDEGEDITSHWIKLDEIDNYLSDIKTLFSISYFLPIIKSMKEA